MHRSISTVVLLLWSHDGLRQISTEERKDETPVLTISSSIPAA